MVCVKGRAEAEEQYEKALEMDPSDEQAVCRLGDIAPQRDDLQEAAASPSCGGPTSAQFYEDGLLASLCSVAAYGASTFQRLIR